MDFERHYLSDTELECWFYLSDDTLDEYVDHIFPERDWKVPLQHDDFTRVAEAAAQDGYQEIKKYSDIEPATQPTIRTEPAPDGLYLVIAFEVVPQIELPDYRAIAEKYTMPSIEVTEEDFEEAKQDILELGVEYEEVNGPCQMNDLITIYYRFLENGQITRQDENTYLKLGQDIFLPGLDEQLVGLKKGKTETFVFDGGEGTSITADITITSIHRPVYPTFDQEFIETYLAEEGITKTEAEQLLWYTAYGMKDAQAQREVLGNIMEEITQNMTKGLPKNLVHSQLNGRVEYFKGPEYGLSIYDLIDYSVRFDHMNDDLTKYGQKKALYAVITRDIYQYEQLETSQEEVQALAESVAEKVSPEGNPDNLPDKEKQELKQGAKLVLREVKALEFLLEFVNDEEDTETYRA